MRIKIVICMSIELSMSIFLIHGYKNKYKILYKSYSLSLPKPYLLSSVGMNFRGKALLQFAFIKKWKVSKKMHEMGYN